MAAMTVAELVAPLPAELPVQAPTQPPVTHIARPDAVVLRLRPRRRVQDSVPAQHGPAPVEMLGVPCAARPSTGFRHYEGPCQCFFGGPAPVFPPAYNPTRP